MARMLYVKASPMDERSSSIAIAHGFVEAYRKHRQIELDTLDLFEAPLPEFGRAAANGKYALLHGEKVADGDAAAWRKVEEMIERFRAAEKYVFAVPMWNFGIPYRLKHFLDLIIQPGYTFSYDPEKGYQGLLTGKKAFVAYAQGGEYSDRAGNASYDMQKPYFELALGFMGITNVVSVVVAPTLAGGPKLAAEKLDTALSSAGELAKDF